MLLKNFLFFQKASEDKIKECHFDEKVKILTSEFVKDAKIDIKQQLEYLRNFLEAKKKVK